MTAARLEVKKLTGAIGAEVHGVDLSAPLDDATVAEIRRIWLEHCVIFFRDQNLTSEQYLAFARRFGKPMDYPFVKGLPDYPVITPVVKLEHERHNFGGMWHTDTTYLPVPPMATMLLSREIPPYGGDTLFANMYLAYDALSDGLKALLDGMIAVNSSAKADVTKSREDRMKAGDAKQGAPEKFDSEHPVVRVHPETGRKALYINGGHTARFKDMTEEESAPLLEYLFRHQVRPEFTCRFVWGTGSLAFWDNRCCQHNPINDYHGHRRVMHRITLEGDKPR